MLGQYGRCQGTTGAGGDPLRSALCPWYVSFHIWVPVQSPADLRINDRHTTT